MYTLKRNNVMTVSGRDRSKRNGENSRVRDKDDRRERERSKEYSREEEGMVECEVKYISKER